jgi:ubiquinone/menaquinone biosynthesis C-methylase UbiE
MGWYGRVMFPRLLDLAMSDPTYESYRRQLLTQVRGSILEIGFGTGLNLPCYPDGVSEITAIDVNPGMSPLAQRRIQDSKISVDLRVLDAQRLPFGSQRFDTVVSTWTLCSIPNIALALQEIRRVLKRDGCFLFLEHGLHPSPKIQMWQRRLDPIQKVLADGCQLSRPMDRLIQAEGFEIDHLETFEASKTPAFLGYFYRGSARTTENRPISI